MGLVVEESEVGERHGHAVLGAGRLHLAVLDAAPGLGHEGHAHAGQVVDGVPAH